MTNRSSATETQPEPSLLEQYAKDGAQLLRNNSEDGAVATAISEVLIFAFKTHGANRMWQELASGVSFAQQLILDPNDAEAGARWDGAILAARLNVSDEEATKRLDDADATWLVEELAK